MCHYFVETYDNYYPGGGTEDLIGPFPTEEMAIGVAVKCDRSDVLQVIQVTPLSEPTLSDTKTNSRVVWTKWDMENDQS